MHAPLRRFVTGVIAYCLLSAAGWADTPQVRAEAAKLNNLGVAMMNQQLMEKATAKFDEAYKLDPSLAVAALNKGIALLNQQRLPEAEEALRQAEAKDPDNPRVWYNLGLVNRGSGNTAEAISDFQKVLKIDPTDPDAYYFLGTFYSQQQEYAKAIDAFQQALKINPLHASAEFGLGRALQRSGQPDEARVHLKRFEYLTHNKISSAITLTYGEQGKYSVAQDVITNDPSVGPMIPVTFVAQALGKGGLHPGQAADGLIRMSGGGVCLLDVDGDGKLDVISMSPQAPPVQVFRNLGNGEWKLLGALDTGFPATGTGVSCAVGDYDNDGKNDIAIALSDRMVLFHNDGGGKFTDVTAKVGITSLNQPAGMTWVDYDHDGDLDLIVTGQQIAGLKDSTNNVVWRNNGNGTFTNWTKETGLAGDGATTSVVLSDINNDRAVDLLVTGANAAPTVYLNQREGPFKAMPLYDAAGLAPTTGVYILDYNKDGWMDVALTHAGAPGVSLWRNVDGTKFERVKLPITDATKGWGITALDFDNDGWIDIAAVVETANGAEVARLPQ